MYNENLVNLVKDRFHECMKNENGGFQPEYYPHIPEKHQEKAMKHFVELGNADETVLMLYDTSLFSKGKNGLAITDQAVYYKDTFSKTKSVKLKNWDPVRDETGKLLGITDSDPLLMTPFLDKLIGDMVTLKKYEGLFDEEEKARIEAEAKAAAEKAEAKKTGEKPEDADDEDDDDDDDDEGGGGIALDLLGIVMDVTSDPTYE